MNQRTFVLWDIFRRTLPLISKIINTMRTSPLKISYGAKNFQIRYFNLSKLFRLLSFFFFCKKKSNQRTFVLWDIFRRTLPLISKIIITMWTSPLKICYDAKNFQIRYFNLSKLFRLLYFFFFCKKKSNQRTFVLWDIFRKTLPLISKIIITMWTSALNICYDAKNFHN